MSRSESEIAGISSDFLFRYELKERSSYNINIRYYEKGVEQDLVGSILNIEPADKDNIIMIAGHRLGGHGMNWGVKASGNMMRFPAHESSFHSLQTGISESWNFFNGGMPDELKLNREQEYTLAYALFNQNASIQASVLESVLLFSELSDTNALEEFDYAYIVTISFLKADWE